MAFGLSFMAEVGRVWRRFKMRRKLYGIGRAGEPVLAVDEKASR
jgi:hypothetical protein